MEDEVAIIKKTIEGKDELASLAWLAEAFAGKVVFSTSLGYEDQVITDMIFKNNLGIKVFTLDTGRIFPETYSLLEETRSYYKATVDVYFPDAAPVEKLVTTKGLFSFYESVENRKECCAIRKVQPLRRALSGSKVWVTGIRAEQSEARHDTPKVEWDEGNKIIKFHPILHWSLSDVKSYIRDHHVPYNTLHDKGFVSIGCQPCTRAIREGEDFRAGRWWWEDQSKKECGLHEK